MSQDSDILEVARRAAREIKQDNAMSQLQGTDSVIGEILQALVNYSVQKKVIRYASSSKIVYYFKKRNIGLYLQLSEFIDFLPYTAICESCGEGKWAHSEAFCEHSSYKNGRYEKSITSQTIREYYNACKEFKLKGLGILPNKD